MRLMVGREMADRYPHRTPHIGDVVFEVKDWRVHHPEHRDRLFIKGVNFQARKGEIVGIAGLMGAGRTELAMSVFGHSWGRRISGEVRMHGRAVDTSTIDRAVAHGLAYVTEDRKALGLVLDDSIAQNVTLANLRGDLARRRDRRRARVRGGGRLPAQAGASAAPAWRSRWSTCRAATSRRWCSPSGCSPNRRC